MIKNYIQSIIFFTLFMVVISIIMPNKKYKPYIEFILGFILVGIVITPFTNVFLKGEGLQEVYYKYDVTEEANQYIEVYEKKQEELINTQFKNQITAQIKSICLNEFEINVSDIKIELIDDSVSKIEIYTAEEVNDVNLKNRLSLSYNLSTKHIDIYIP